MKSDNDEMIINMKFMDDSIKAIGQFYYSKFNILVLKNSFILDYRGVLLNISLVVRKAHIIKDSKKVDNAIYWEDSFTLSELKNCPKTKAINETNGNSYFYVKEFAKYISKIISYNVNIIKRIQYEYCDVEIPIGEKWVIRALVDEFSRGYSWEEDSVYSEYECFIITGIKVNSIA